LGAGEEAGNDAGDGADFVATDWVGRDCVGGTGVRVGGGDVGAAVGCAGTAVVALTVLGVSACPPQAVSTNSTGKTSMAHANTGCDLKAD
jgi:hypothetical protein